MNIAEQTLSQLQTNMSSIRPQFYKTQRSYDNYKECIENAKEIHL